MIVLVVLQSALAASLVVIIWSYLKHHREHMPLLSTVGFEPTGDGVLIVVPAKDEEEGISACLERMMGLKGLQNCQVVAVDDRSVDGTQARMREAASRFPGRIQVAGITELPGGWLGKNHACWVGAQQGLKSMPNAKYIVFTDGDVKFHPDTVAESVKWMKGRDLHFMTLIEDSEFEGILEPAYLLLFGVFLIFFSARPWLLHRRKGKNFMGNGAYLVVRRDAYESTRAHETLKLEVVEDMRMGLLMRSRGLNCGTAVGLDRVRRRWQPGFRGIFKGLLKNSFAAFEYSVPMTAVGVLFFPFVFLVPWVLLCTGHVVGLINVILIGVCFWMGSQNSRLPWLSGFLLSPFLCLASSANLATSAIQTLKNGGVSWRGTLYPIADLKAQCLTIRKAFGTRTT